MSSAASLALGGENGPAIVAGNLDESLIWQRISAGEMPPDEPLSAADQTILRRWIEAGADGLPRPDDPATKRDALHWAFRSLVRPTVPKLIRQNTIVRTAIDRFVQQRLESAGLSISSEAERAALIRRVCFDLTGLPPTPEAILEFQADRATDAYQKLVDAIWLRHTTASAGANTGWMRLAMRTPTGTSPRTPIGRWLIATATGSSAHLTKINRMTSLSATNWRATSWPWFSKPGKHLKRTAATSRPGLSRCTSRSWR